MTLVELAAKMTEKQLKKNIDQIEYDFKVNKFNGFEREYWNRTLEIYKSALEQKQVSWPILISKIRRAKNNMSQEGLAKLLGTTQKTISKWENGLDTPNLLNAQKIQELYLETLQQQKTA